MRQPCMRRACSDRHTVKTRDSKRMFYHGAVKGLIPEKMATPLVGWSLGASLSEKDIPGPRNSGSGDIGYGFVDLRRPGFEQSNNGLRLVDSGIGVRVKHRRSGDPGLWVRNKEQWADRRVMTSNTRVRGLRRVSRSSSIRRP